MAPMTDPHQAALSALSEEFTALSRQMARVANQLSELERNLPAPQPTPPPQPYPVPVPVMAPPFPQSQYPIYHPYPVQPPLMPPPAYLPPRTAPAAPRPTLAARISGDAERGLIGKLLAVAGVAVTLIGVVLLLVLAAQAGILRPEIRVGAGALLAGALVAIAARLNRRPGGRIGAVALAATGIAAAYIDIVAATTIYHWVGPAISLIVASAIGGGGLVLARRWDSEQLGLLVLVPLVILAPIVTDGITLTLVAFMLALSAAALPVQLGKDWVWMHAARTAAVSGPLLLALLINRVVTGDDPRLLGGACAIAAALAVGGALILMPWITNRVAMALVTVAGVLPALSAAFAVGRVLGALLAAAVAVAMLAIVLSGSRLPGVEGPVRRIWAALSAVSALIAVTVAFDGAVAGPVLLALAVVVTMAGSRELVARWAAIGFAVVGAAFFLGYAPPRALVQPTLLSTPAAVSALAASLLLIAVSVAIAQSWTNGKDPDGGIRLIWAGVVAVTAYCVTAFTVTAGVLVGGLDGGFLAGQMAATICWIAIAAGLFAFALRVQQRDARTAPIAGGLALTAAAMAKLFLFDLGTLDGIFRVVAFIVVGLALLGMGSGYARSLAQQDRSSQV
jgi:uncharacterized membrane protein